LVVSTSPKAASASTAPSASASRTETAPLVTGRCAVRLTWRSNSRSATSLMQQPALRIRMVPSVNTASRCQPGKPSAAIHSADSVGHSSSSQPAGRFQRIRSRYSEGDEHQSVLAVVRPGHGAAKHEGLGLEALLCGAFDVGGSRRIVKFVVVAAPPPDHVVLLPRPHAFKSVQVVHPLLHGHEAGAIQAGALAVGQRGLFGRSILRVLRAIFIAGQVPAMAVGAAPMAKRLDRALKPQCRCQRLLDRARGMHQLAAIGATQPAPQGGGGWRAPRPGAPSRPQRRAGRAPWPPTRRPHPDRCRPRHGVHRPGVPDASGLRPRRTAA
jgi:hypothetical protein